MNLRDCIGHALDQERIADARILVACSGGPDSLALAHALMLLKESHRLEFVLAHFNHQLRGHESDGDEAFVAKFGERHGLPVAIARADVRQAALQGGSNLEAEARKTRYAWLAQTAKQLSAAWVMTGHTADDQAETVLHNLLRGTGLRGLRGIARRRPLAKGVMLMRPLLDATRDCVLEHLNSMGLTSRRDSTNDDLSLTRNRIRLELLPLLKKTYNVRVSAALARLANQVQEYWEERDARIREELGRAELPRAREAIVLDAAKLALLSNAMMIDVLYFIWERESWPRGNMSHGHWQDLAQLVRTGNGRRDLPDGVGVEMHDRVLTLERRKRQERLGLVSPRDSTDGTDVEEHCAEPNSR